MSSKMKLTVDEVSHNLLNFSVNREALAKAFENFPQDEGANPVAIEYELQILRIVSVGWGLSFFMEDSSEREALAETFWNGVQAFSGAISSLTSTSIGKEVDYFGVLKERLDLYIMVLNHFSKVNDPGAVIGPTFAKLCGSEESEAVIAAGKKMFTLSIDFVRAYLESVEIA